MLLCYCIIFYVQVRQAPLASCGRGNIAVAPFSLFFVSNCSGLGAFIRGTYSFMVATPFCIRTMSSITDFVWFMAASSTPSSPVLLFLCRQRLRHTHAH